MTVFTMLCARCAGENLSLSRFCAACGLPLGSASPDADVVRDVLGPYEPPEPADPDLGGLLRDLVQRSGFDAAPAGWGWRVVVSVPPDRRQAVYLGPAGSDLEGRPMLSLVSVCGPATQRDAQILLKLNARVVAGHFAIKTLRGEEYFVVIRNMWAEIVPHLDAAAIVRRIAEVADSLEERLSRGRDRY